MRVAIYDINEMIVSIKRGASAARQALIDDYVDFLLVRRDMFWTVDELVVLRQFIETYNQSNNSLCRFSPPSCLRMKIVDAYVAMLVPLPRGLLEYVQHELARYLHDDPWVCIYFFVFAFCLVCS